MMKYNIVFIISIIISAVIFETGPAKAGSLGQTRVFYLTGKRSQTDGLEDRDLSGDYSFYKYGVSVKAKPLEDFYYRAGVNNYHKKFDTSDNKLDNNTNLYSAYFSIPVKNTKQESLKFNTGYNLRTKRYKNSPNSEYDNNRLSGGFDIRFREHYSLGISAGINDYDYHKKHSSDKFKSSIGINPSAKLLDEKLKVSGYYKRNWVNNSGDRKDYTEDSVSLRSSLKLDNPFLNKIKGHFGYGRSDTQDDDEDREDNLRFEYRIWDITTGHKINNAIETQMDYGQAHRDYFTSLNSYDNWFLKNKTKYALIKNEPFKMDLLLGYEHKESKYSQNNSLSYNKNSLSGGFNLLSKGEWSIKPGFTFTRYKYQPLSPKNESQYKADISCKKYIHSTDNALELGYWYKWKNYKYKPSVEQWAMDIAYSIKF